jgi:hypothetical protein
MMQVLRRLALPVLAVALLAACENRLTHVMAPAAPQHAQAEFIHPASNTSLWFPAPGTTWQWQLNTPPAVEPIDDAQMYDIDMFDNDAAKVEQLHDTGSKVVCYIDAGTWERWRPDARKFPKIVLGKQNGWPGERYLDIRRIDIIGPLMAARVAQCAAKAFDGVEFDNVDVYQATTGFPLSADDELRYNRFLAGLAHGKGLSAALKNDPDQVTQLSPQFEFAIVEQCFQDSYCNKEAPFIQAGKAVFETEYKWKTSQFCAQANAMRFSAMRKRLKLDRWRQPCWP